MMFFKRNAPTIVDYDKTKSELLRLEWLAEIYNIETNKSVYDITDLGYQYYFAICMSVGCDQLFDGPRLAEGQDRAFINEDIKLVGEGYLIDGIDCQKLTPKAAEYLYVLTDLHGKEITIKNQNAKTAKSGSMNKVGKYTAMFVRKASVKMADAQNKMQQFTGGGKTKKKSKRSRSRKADIFGDGEEYDDDRVIININNGVKQRRKSKSKKKRKKSTDTTKSEYSGGFDFKGIGDKMMK